MIIFWDAGQGKQIQYADGSRRFVCVAISVLMIPLMPGCGKYMADLLDLDFWL